MTKFWRRLRVALRSRRLLRSWFSAGFAYYLWRVGLRKAPRIEVKCFDGNSLAINTSFYKLIVNGFYDGFIQELSCREGKAKIRGSWVPLDAIGDLSAVVKAFGEGWLYDDKCGCWVYGNVKFKRLYYNMLDVFSYGHYGFLFLDGLDVVDVGGFVGDSAIYFISRGAHRVVALEPHPGAFGGMVENIMLNNLEGRIIPVNAGLSNLGGCVEVAGSSISEMQGLHHERVLSSESLSYRDCVKALTLDDIIRDYSVDPGNTILKLDCEGCEYEVILGDYDHVRLFREVVVEYHRGYREVLKVMDKDFTCRHEAKHLFSNLTRQGLLHCTKRVMLSTPLF